MNIKTRDIVIVAFVMFIGFPVVYFFVMFAMGNTRFNDKKAPKKEFTEAVVSMVKQEKKLNTDSLAAVSSISFQALQNERSGLEEERRKMEEEKQRMELFAAELDTKKDALKAERERIEKLVEKSDTFDKKKSLQLAKAYTAMRPAEAAQILSTLSDENAMRIISGITDDRIKAKIIAALPPEKSTSITRAMVESTNLR